MIPKERFLAALNRRPVDRIPMFDFLFQRRLFEELIGRTPASYNAKDALELTKALGLDGVWIPYGCFSGWSPTLLSDRTYIDEWGTTFETNEASWPIDAPIAFPLKGRDDLGSYRIPDPLAPGRTDEIDRALELNEQLGQEAVAILGGVGGPLTVSWMLVGYEAICLSLYDDPAFLRDVARLAVDFSVPAIDRMAAAGVDGMVVSEDLGSSAGGLLSPRHFREIYRPALKTIMDHIRSKNLPVLFHSCGRIYDYLDDLVELGISAIHPLQRTAGMDMARVKREYGKRICIVGNIDSSRTLPYGDLDAVEKETRETMSMAAPGYGYILASDHSLHDGIPVRNIVRMFETCRKYG